MILFTVLYLICFSFLIATCYNQKMTKFHVLAKSLTSLCFLGMAVYVFLPREKTLFTLLWLGAFFLCFLGDVFLAVRQQAQKEWCFLGGVLAFLLGHCMFVRTLCEKAPFRIWDLIPAILLVGLTWYLINRPSMEAGTMKYPSVVYSFFVSMLCIKGLEVPFYQGASTVSLLLAAGTASFMISDTIILFLYFRKKKIKSLHFFNLLTYYLAVYLLILGNW